MEIKTLVPQSIAYVRYYLYRGWLKHLVRRTRLGTYLAKIYWRIFIRYMTYKECSINKTKAKFKIDTLREYKRISELGDEEPVLADILGNLRSEDVFYDIGANIGLYSNLVGRQVSEGQIIAFEPHPKNVDKLEENLAINDVDGQVISHALSDTDARMAFNLCDDKPGVGKPSFVNNKPNNQDKIVQVRTIPGDALIDRGEIPSPTVIKIDVEGAENKVLEGLSGALTNPACRLVYCEIHHKRLPEFGSNPDQILKLLEEFGFRVSTLYHRDSRSFIRAKRAE